MDKQKEIFLSYAQSDQDFVQRLTYSLNQEHPGLFFTDNNVAPGSARTLVVENRLSRCNAVIAVLSPNYFACQQCQDELARAKRLNKQIFPLQIGALPAPQEWPIILQRIEVSDFSHWQDMDFFQKRLQQLIGAILNTEMDFALNERQHYLETLIRTLENCRGVQDYVELLAQATPIAPPTSRLSIAEDWERELLKLSTNERERAWMKKGNYQSKSADSSSTIVIEPIFVTAERIPKFVLLGDPGAGKTTTLRRLAYNSAIESLQKNSSTPLPFLVYLRDCKGEEPEKFIRQEWNEKWGLKGDPIKQIREGNILLYLDALDEIPENKPGVRHKKVEELDKWIWKNVARVIVTCRTRQYVGKMRLSSLPTEVHAEALNEELIRRFSTRYLNDRANGFLNQIFPQNETEKEDVYQLFKLAQNPCLLYALIVVYDSQQTEGLPKNPGLLFRQMAKALLARHRDKQLDDIQISFNIMEEAFGRLAYAMIDENKPGAVEIEMARRQLVHGVWWRGLTKNQVREADRLLELAQGSNWIEFFDNCIEFYHPLMQAYFAAVQLQKENSFWQLEQSSRIVLRQRRSSSPPGLAREGKWDHTVIALSGIYDTNTVIRRVMNLNPHLAAQCFYSGDEVFDKTKEDVVQKLLDTLSYPSDKDEFWTGVYECDEYESILGWDKKTVNAVKKEIIRQIAADALKIIGQPAIDGLIDLLKKLDYNVHHHVKKALTEIGLYSIEQLMNAYSKNEISEELRTVILEIIMQIVTDEDQEQSLAKLTRFIELNPTKRDGYFLRGRFHLQKKNHEAALEDFAHAIKITPAKVDSFIFRAECYRDLHKYDESLKDLNLVIGYEPNEAENYNLRGLVYMDKGELRAAADDFSQAIDLQPDEVVYYDNLLEAYRALHQDDFALSELTQAVERDPENGFRYAALATFRSRCGDQNGALEDINRAIELQPEQAENYNRRGLVYLYKGEPHAAVADFNHAIELKAEEVVYYDNLVLAYQALNDDNVVLSELTQAVERDPENGFRYAALATFRSRCGDQNGALEDINRAIELKPDDTYLLTRKIEICIALGSRQQALDDLSHYIELTPGTPGQAYGYILRGRIYQQTGDLSTAAEDFSQAVKIEPNRVEYILERAGCYRSLKEFDKALSDLNRIMELEPGVAEHYNRRGLVYLDKAEPRTAADDFNHAIELQPEEFKYYLKIVEAYIALQQDEMVLSELTQAVEREPENKFRYAARAIFRSRCGDQKGALEDMNQAIELKPDDANLVAQRISICVASGDIQQAEDDIMQYIDLIPDKPGGYFFRASLYWLMERYPEALADINNAVEINSEDAKGYLHRAHIYGDTGNIDAAIDNYKHVLEIMPDYSSAYHFLALARLDKEEYDLALKDLMEDVKLDTSNVSTAYNLFWQGLVLELQGQQVDAQKTLKQAWLRATALEDNLQKHRLLMLITLIMNDTRAAREHSRGMFRHNKDIYSMCLQRCYLRRLKRVLFEQKEIAEFVDWFEAEMRSFYSLT
ncbi:MAG: tetratricopeptide repeat protein [Candidatus Hodarchaeota archaeon]